MRHELFRIVLLGSLTLGLIASATVCAKADMLSIAYSVTPVGSFDYQYQFFLSGQPFAAGEYFDIYFDSSAFGSIANGAANPAANWNVQLLPVNSPPGASGVYSPLALVEAPGFAGTFTVDASVLAANLPDSLPFDVVSAQNVVTETGLALPEVNSSVPEPASFYLFLSGLLLSCALMTRKGQQSRRGK